jgi:hypothetical protein
MMSGTTHLSQLLGLQLIATSTVGWHLHQQPMPCSRSSVHTLTLRCCLFSCVLPALCPAMRHVLASSQQLCHASTPSGVFTQRGSTSLQDSCALQRWRTCCQVPTAIGQLSVHAATCEQPLSALLQTAHSNCAQPVALCYSATCCLHSCSWSLVVLQSSQRPIARLPSAALLPAGC